MLPGFGGANGGPEEGSPASDCLGSGPSFGSSTSGSTPLPGAGEVVPAVGVAGFPGKSVADIGVNAKG
jgi:hypothetical protein